MGSVRTNDYGSRLMPSLIDDIAKNEPEKPWGSMPKDSRDLSKGWMDISYAVFSNAINRSALWIEEQFGPSNSFEPISYFGPGDHRTFVMFLAIMKTRHVAVSFNPSAGPGDLLAGLAHCKCTRVIIANEYMDTLGPIFNTQSDLTVMPALDLDEVFDPTPAGLYPFPKTFQEAVDDPAAIFQTGGSAGMPKTFTVTHGYFATFDAYRLVKPFEARSPTITRCRENERHLWGFPPFHICGMVVSLTDSIFHGVVVLRDRIRSWPMTTEGMLEIIEYGNVQAFNAVPSLLEDLVPKYPRCLELFRDMTYVSYGGAPLRRDIGDKIAKVSFLTTVMGASETGGFVTHMVHDDVHWEYLLFSPTCNGFEWREHGDNLFEPVIVRDPKLRSWQGIFHTFPDMQEYRTNDLYSKHPSREHYWRHEGRADDILLLTSGRNILPQNLERVIEKNSYVKSVTIDAHQRPRVSALIEPTDDAAGLDREQLLELIWPSILGSNANAPHHGQLSKEFVIFSKKEKPMPLTVKRVRNRGKTLNLYKDEFDALYV